jgi:hypothetical protein
MLDKTKKERALDKVWRALHIDLKLPISELTRITNMVEVELNKIK